MHIAPFNNRNKAIVDINDDLVPLTYFNIVKLTAGERFHYKVSGYETCIVPATGTIDVEVVGQTYEAVGNRKVDVWGGEPEAVYVPVGIEAKLTCLTQDTEVFIAGAKYDKVITRSFAESKNFFHICNIIIVMLFLKLTSYLFSIS